MEHKTTALIMVLAATLALSACGRRGPLEAPGGPVAQPQQQDAQQTEEPPVEDRPFILDGLIE